MTNNWSDIGNATCVLIWGANPSENHPACMAHVNRARAKGAKLIVVDPRKSRTALQADQYIRIRPGTDIALANGVVREIIRQMELPSGQGPTDTQKGKFFEYLNYSGKNQYWSDGAGGASPASSTTQLVDGMSKYTDARFLVDVASGDYQRERVDASGVATSGAASGNTFSNVPKRSADCRTGTTVYNALKAHVDNYTTAAVADICDCTEQEVRDLANYFIEHSRCSSVADATSPGVDNSAGTPTAAQMQDPTKAGYKVLTMLYAMGITQHTCGSANVKSFAVLQSLMGNSGRAGGGINALRGIHNVQGSTDMGLLYGNIPAYSSNPSTQVDAIPSTNNAFGKYMDALWGSPLSGTAGRTNMNGSYDDAYDRTKGNLQQAGFYNMTLKWFADWSTVDVLTGAAKRTAVDAAYSLWPKGNGDNHVKMFRNMALPETDLNRIKAAIVWGQNPAVTEPNQGKIREGLKNLDLLVVTDMFETETAAVERKAGSVTYLLPSCSHVEKAGSATNSGRVLQWRYKALDPQGNSRDDLEMIMRFAQALDTAGAFKHIKDTWDAYGMTYDGGVYKQLYAKPYGMVSGASVVPFLSATGNVEKVTLQTVKSAVDSNYSTVSASGSEWVSDNIFKEMCLPNASGGTIWIYVEAYNSALGKTRLAGSYTDWKVANRAKSRSTEDPYGTLAFSKWGYSWLVNRRVLYNNKEIPGDQADYFMGPDSASRLWSPKAMPAGVAVYNYSKWYRSIVAPTNHTLADRPMRADGTMPAKHVHPGRFPAHVEPYETPRTDLIDDYGYNSTETSSINALGFRNLIYSGTKTSLDFPAGKYPLVLTSIRCVEHFQGGPITRNNMYNSELEPEPWIELNSADARAYGIKDGDYVKIVTARTEDFDNQELAPYGSGFRARVGVGLAANQRVAQGVVAIPWHWGEKGLSTGSRANDLCIDAVDANSTIPESKACLCRIVKM